MFLSVIYKETVFLLFYYPLKKKILFWKRDRYIPYTLTHYHHVIKITSVCDACWVI